MLAWRTGPVVLVAIACALSACGGGAGTPEEPLGTESSALSSVCPAIPTPGAPFSPSGPIAPGDSCLGGTSDTSGYFMTSHSTPGFTYFTLYRPDHSLVENLGTHGEGMMMQPMFVGFQLVSSSGSPPTAEALAWLPDSGGIGVNTTFQNTGVNHLWHHSLDYGGGSLVAYGNTSSTGSHFFTVFARRFNSTGNPRSDGVFVETMHFAPAFVAGGVNLSGHSLVLFDGVQVGMGATHVAGRWFDRNGLPLSALFDAGTATGASDIGVQVDTVPLFDNSIAVRVNGVWALHVRDLATAGSAVPSWMNSHAPGRGLRLLSGNRGYAAHSLGGEAAAVCAQDVKVLAPDGHLCGTVAFPISASACTTGPMSVGRDGTAIQGLPPACSGSGCTCTHRVWNALFH